MKTIAIPDLQTETSMFDAIGALEILNKRCGPWCQIDQSESGSFLFNVQVVRDRCLDD